jgi:hypothetical protein
MNSYFNSAFGQGKLLLSEVQIQADSLYKAKQYSRAGNFYSVLAERSDFENKKSTAYYNMACCISLQGMPDSALLVLGKAIKAGYNDTANVLKDKDLMPLHNLSQWRALINNIPSSKKVLNDSPANARFITTDIHHFWEAYDKAVKDTAHFTQIIKKLYFNRATEGMNDYMGAKVSSINFFVEHIRSAPNFYAAIRKNTMMTDQFKPAFLASYFKLKSLYKEAKFPDVYFMIGAFTSGGTATDLGLLVAVNQTSSDSKVPLDELNSKKRTRLNNIDVMPAMVGHELIHFQQDGMKGDTTTLCYAITEGMADFIGELITGKTINSALYAWAKGKEKQIWRKFSDDMYYNRYENWIGNSQQSSADNLPDQGYWIGYQICKSYYDQSPDKKQAINEMLHIQDYKDFLAKSKWKEKVATL